MSERTKGVLLIALAALICVGCSLLFLNTPSELDRMTEVAHDAKVARVRVHEDDDGDKDYTPTFTFTDSDQRTFEAKSLLDYPQEIEVGERYDVRYNPYKPGAGCLIVGHEQRLRGQEASFYALPFIVIAIIAGLAWKQMGSPRVSSSTDETNG